RAAMLQLKPERFAVEEFRSQPISICGKALVADQSGALFWPTQRTLIVADLDVDGSRRQSDPTMPRLPGKFRTALIRLAEAIDRYEPGTVAVLGGNWHAAQAAQCIADDALAILHMMQEDRRWVWVRRNGLANGQGSGPLGGETLPELALDTIVLRHEPK